MRRLSTAFAATALLARLEEGGEELACEPPE